MDDENENLTITVGLLSILASPLICVYYKIKNTLLGDEE